MNYDEWAVKFPSGEVMKHSIGELDLIVGFKNILYLSDLVWIESLKLLLYLIDVNKWT